MLYRDQKLIWDSSISKAHKTQLYVTQRELMRLSEGDIKTDILN